MSLIINWYLLFAALNLTVQIVVLLLLMYGYSLKIKKQFLRHARVMTTAVAAHLIMVFSFMIPSFVLALVPACAVHFSRIRPKRLAIIAEHYMRSNDVR